MFNKLFMRSKFGITFEDIKGETHHRSYSIIIKTNDPNYKVSDDLVKDTQTLLLKLAEGAK